MKIRDSHESVSRWKMGTREAVERRGSDVDPLRGELGSDGFGGQWSCPSDKRRAPLPEDHCGKSAGGALGFYLSASWELRAGGLRALKPGPADPVIGPTSSLPQGD
jgi:hypothetical protein